MNIAGCIGLYINIVIVYIAIICKTYISLYSVKPNKFF